MLLLYKLKQLFCRHKELHCLTNIYGDYINIISTRSKIYRSIRQCTKCGKIIYSEKLDKTCKIVNWKNK